jgi:hypothetical protein
VDQRSERPRHSIEARNPSELSITPPATEIFQVR